MSCRAGDGWSAPVFFQLAKGSWGFQAGVEQVDLVLLVMNDRGVQKLLENKTTLGVDASVAAGPVGRRAAVATDALMTAEILSYSRSHGLFAGINVSGGVLRPDEDTNVAVYGAGAEPRTILASRELSAPPEAKPSLDALRTASSPTTTETTAQPPAAASTPPTRRTTTAPTTDDDLRARVVDIQQSLDRILADTTPAAVGTGGTVATTTGTSDPNKRVKSAPPSVTSRPAASPPDRITARSNPPESIPGEPVISSAPTCSSPASSARVSAASSCAMT